MGARCRASTAGCPRLWDRGAGGVPRGKRSPSLPPAPLTSSRAPTAPRHFCILEAKAVAAGELRSSPVTARNSATLICSGMVRAAPGGYRGGHREGGAGG